MKANQTNALIAALMLSVSTLVSCGAQQPDSAAESQPSGSSRTAESSDIIGGDGIIEGSFGKIAGQELPEAAIPAKPDGAAPRKDDDGFRELQHKIYSANLKDAIFKNHTSLALTLDDKYQHVYDMADYVYLAPDYSYGHASYYQQYSKDREILQYVGTDSNSPYPVYVADLSENYTGHVYWYVPQEEATFFNAEHETITDVCEKGGVLWQYSVMDETGSKNYFENMIDGAYGGEIVHCFEIVNAENYEIIEARQYAEKDGKTYLLGIHKMQYDLPEPEEVSAFLKIFDNGDKDTSTVTYIANPGKDNEISKSMTVPQHSVVSFYSQDMPETKVFLDKECTKPSYQGWDGISDTVFYVIPKNS